MQSNSHPRGCKLQHNLLLFLFEDDRLGKASWSSTDVALHLLSPCDCASPTVRVAATTYINSQPNINRLTTGAEARLMVKNALLSGQRMVLPTRLSDLLAGDLQNRRLTAVPAWKLLQVKGCRVFRHECHMYAFSQGKPGSLHLTDLHLKQKLMLDAPLDTNNGHGHAAQAWHRHQLWLPVCKPLQTLPTLPTTFQAGEGLYITWGGMISSSVWNSAMRFCTRSRSRLRPVRMPSCWDGGINDLHHNAEHLQQNGQACT